MSGVTSLQGLPGFHTDRKLSFPLLLILQIKIEEAQCQLSRRGEEDDGRLPGGYGLPSVPAGPRYVSN